MVGWTWDKPIRSNRNLLHLLGKYCLSIKVLPENISEVRAIILNCWAALIHFVFKEVMLGGNVCWNVPLSQSSRVSETLIMVAVKIENRTDTFTTVDWFVNCDCCLSTVGHAPIRSTRRFPSLPLFSIEGTCADEISRELWTLYTCVWFVGPKWPLEWPMVDHWAGALPQCQPVHSRVAHWFRRHCQLTSGTSVDTWPRLARPELACRASCSSVPSAWQPSERTHALNGARRFASDRRRSICPFETPTLIPRYDLHTQIHLSTLINTWAPCSGHLLSSNPKFQQLLALFRKKMRGTRSVFNACEGGQLAAKNISCGGLT